MSIINGIFFLFFFFHITDILLHHSWKPEALFYEVGITGEEWKNYWALANL